MQKAGALLARRSYSKGELRTRLRKLGEEEEVETALSRLEGLGLLNDAEYAYNFASRRIKEMAWGAVKVHHSLIRRHVAPHLAESAIDRVHHEISEDLVLSQYLDKLGKKNGLPRDRKAIQKLVSHLRSRGFQEDHIWNVLHERIPTATWRSYDTGE